MKKKSFYLFIDSLEVLDELTLEQAGTLFIAIREYNKGSDPKLGGLMKAVFHPFKMQFDRDMESYEKAVAIGRETGKLGGRKKGNKG